MGGDADQVTWSGTRTGDAHERAYRAWTCVRGDDLRRRARYLPPALPGNDAGEPDSTLCARLSPRRQPSPEFVNYATALLHSPRDPADAPRCGAGGGEIARIVHCAAARSRSSRATAPETAASRFRAGSITTLFRERKRRRCSVSRQETRCLATASFWEVGNADRRFPA
jgi:hypothetical protein